MTIMKTLIVKIIELTDGKTIKLFLLDKGEDQKL